ncbi:integrase family protein [Bradyrhizobium sp. CCBAU 53338]|uniref:integrase family protein n=1 Tax=Bradyrhizobium sp. CCBAU 53338 TaxID=1325111 RepID=UPI00188DAD8E|nr:integrase family protein [Bradyrhizobium sp. CCBAU 53338]
MNAEHESRQKITAKTLEKAVSDCAAGNQYEVSDLQCGGLQLRVRGSVTWTVRSRLWGKQRRWAIGGPEIKPDIARERAGEVKGWCRRGMDPEMLVIQYMTGVPIANQTRVGGKRPVPSWSWARSVDAFLDHILKFRSPETYDDYARTLGGKMRLDEKKRHSKVPELERFEDKDVAAITREDVAKCVAEVCNRAHRTGEHLKSVLGSMWTFLADDCRREETSVAPNLLLRLKTPERQRPTIVRDTPDIIALFEDDSEDPNRDVPSPARLGRALAIARSRAMKETAALSIELLAGSLQRRRAVIGSHRAEFRVMGDWEDQSADILWSIPPFMRKRSNRRRAHLPHKIVLVHPTVLAVRRLDTLAGDQAYYFPVRAGQDKKTKNPHADPSFINHALQFLPGAEMSCHAWRRGFASHGQRELGLDLVEIKMVLDHSEGAPPCDVTAGNYALDPLLGRKREILLAWSEWLETRVKEAIAADPGLLDVEALKDAIYLARYGKERINRKDEERASTLLDAAE